MTELNFHVRHEVTPDRVWDVLTAVNEGNNFDHIVQADRQLGRLRQLRLVIKEKNGLRPSTDGCDLCRIGAQKPDVAMELLHYMHYSLWSREAPLENTLSWSYRAYCDLLFQRKSYEFSLSAREALTAELNAFITGSEVFAPFINQTKKGAVALSTNSLNGMNHWLRRLIPPVVENDIFTLRTFCSPELLVMAISFQMHETGADLTVDQLLTPERREIICKLCLLDLDCLDRALDWMIPLYPDVIQPGTRTGSYGRFIHLLHVPTFKDLLP